MTKKILLILISSLIIFNAFAGNKMLEKGLMQITDDKTGAVTYKIRWETPDGSESFWLDAVPSDSADAFAGSMEATTPDTDPVESISLGGYTVSKKGMERAVRAVEDIWRAVNQPKVGGGGGSSSSSSSGSC